MSRWVDPGIWREPFLEALARGLSVMRAAREAGTSKQNVHYHRERDQSFREAWDAAVIEGRARCAQCGSSDLVPIAGREEGRWRCRVCAAAATRRYKERHPERHTTEARRPEASSYYERNREKIIRKSVEWHRRNPERRRAILKRYYSKPEVRIRHRRPGRRAADYMAILVADPCCYCGQPTEQIDHICAVARGGGDEWTNLTAACRACNMRKLDNSLLGFLGGVSIRRLGAK